MTVMIWLSIAKMNVVSTDVLINRMRYRLPYEDNIKVKAWLGFRCIRTF